MFAYDWFSPYYSIVAFVILYLCSFPTGQATITPAGMTIMPSSHLYGHTSLLQSPMPLLSTTADTTGGQIITAGISPPTGYAGMCLEHSI